MQISNLKMSAILCKAALLCTLSVSFGVVNAQDERTITLANHDVLSLSDFRVEADVASGKHPILGEVRFHRSDILSIDPPFEVDSNTNQSGDSKPANSNPVSAPQKDSKEASPWKRNVSASLSGSEGKGDGVNARLSFETSRTGSKMRTKLRSVYVHSKDDTGVQRSRFDTDGRNDWLITDSRWRIFAIGRAEYDEYADWDWRATLSSGFGYEFVDNAKHELVGRTGLGASQTLGGDDAELIPIGVLGVDYTWRISDRSAFATVVDYTPDISNPSEFRTESAAAYHVKLREDAPLTLRIGTGHRYDSAARTSERNDYEYFMALGWDF